MVERVDNVTRYIQEQLIANNLQHRVNVIYLSDHGMIGVTPPNFINLTEFVVKDSCKMYGSSPVLQIVPTNPSESKMKNKQTIFGDLHNFKCLGFENEIFANLTRAAEQNGHFKVYNRDNLLDRWHANSARRMGPVLAVADAGYGFQDLMRKAIKYKRKHHVPSEIRVYI